MRRGRIPLRPSAFWSWSALAIVVACSVYDESLLTGGATPGKGGTSGASSGGAGGSDPSGGTGGGGGSGARGGSPASGGTAGDTGGTSGSTSGGAGGSNGGTTSTGGSEGGEGGEGETGGSGVVAGSGGARGGSAGAGGSGGAAGSGGSAGAAGSGGKCGVCGCSVPDTDTDADGVPDCNDICPGLVDAHCTALRTALRNRYSFGGTGTVVTDSKGTAHGTAVNATLGGAGTLTLAGGNTSSPPYVNLPNGLISSLTNATFELWVTWNQSGTTGQDWQRIFDFGTSGTEDMQTTSGSTTMSYLFLTPLAGAAPRGLRASYSTTGINGETSVGTATALATASVQHIAVVIDDTNDQMVLYLNGVLQQGAPFAGSLAQIADVNNWLARSQWSGDYEFIGVFDEFRIYTAALSEAQITTSRAAGANATFLQ